MLEGIIKPKGVDLLYKFDEKMRLGMWLTWGLCAIKLNLQNIDADALLGVNFSILLSTSAKAMSNTIGIYDGKNAKKMIIRWRSKCISMVIARITNRNIAFKAAKMDKTALELQ